MLKIRKLKNELFNEIDILIEKKNCSYMEAVIIFCESNEIDLEQAANIILANNISVEHIEIEASALNFLKKDAK